MLRLTQEGARSWYWGALLSIALVGCQDPPPTANPGPDPPDPEAPQALGCILWTGDHEEGSLFDWHYGDDPDAGGGVFNTGGGEVEAMATDAFAHGGQYSAKATITNALRAENGNRAVRLMRWTDRHWAEGGDYFPASSYYSVWMYFPKTYNPNKYQPWDPGDGGWWNVFQFKSEDADGVSQPMFTVNVAHDDSSDAMSFYMYSKYNTPASYGPLEEVSIPVGEWVHVEARYDVSTDDGLIAVWQDGVKILEAVGVQTVRPGGPEKAVWGIGNYTDHVVGDEIDGSATIYFDDALVSTGRAYPAPLAPC